MERPNYYILLDLDASETDPGVIDKAIAGKQAEWSRGDQSPSNALRLKQYRAMLPDIRALMMDPQRRAKEAEASRERRKQMREEALRKLGEDIDVLDSGEVMQAQLDFLIARYKGRLTEAEVKSRIPGTIQNQPQRTGKNAGTLHGLTDIAVNLECLNKKDLYDYLEVPRSSSEASIQERTRKKNEAALRNNNKTAEVDAAGNLCGHCRSILFDKTKRQQYDEFLDKQALLALDPQIELVGVVGEIRTHSFDRLVRKAMGAGIPENEAREYIMDFARRKRWIAYVPQSERWQEWKYCPCHTLNRPSALMCEQCGQPLEVECPKCRAKNPSRHRACSHCGFAVGDYPLFHQLMRDAEKAAASGETLEALNLVRQAGVLWHDSPAAKAAEERLAREFKQGQDEMRRIEETIRERRLIDAERHLAEFERRWPNHRQLNELKSKAAAGVRSAIEDADRARRHERSQRPHEALAAYLAALHKCGDLPEVLQGLSRLPYQASALAAASDSQRISLRWKAAPPGGEVTYRILRKSGGAPRTISDGERIGETVSTSFFDSNAAPGELYFYAVFTMRDGIPARTPEVTGPVCRRAEVTSLRARPGDRSVTLEWKAPPKFRRIEVWRQVGREPGRIGDGVKVPNVAEGAVIDRGLKEDTTYGYRVFVFYNNPDGSSSEGDCCLVHLATPPTPVTDLTCEPRGNDLMIRWPSPERGKDVRLYAFEGDTPPGAGSIVSPVELAGLGRPIPVTNGSSTLMALPPNRFFHVVPATVNGSCAAIGKAMLAGRVEDVSYLAVEIQEGILSARWKWPRGIESVVVSVRSDDPPTGRDDPAAAITKSFQLFEYERKSCFLCAAPAANRSVHVFVCAALYHHGQWSYATGSSPGARAQVIAGGRPGIRFHGWSEPPPCALQSQ